MACFTHLADQFISLSSFYTEKKLQPSISQKLEGLQTEEASDIIELDQSTNTGEQHSQHRCKVIPFNPNEDTELTGLEVHLRLHYMLSDR